MFRRRPPVEPEGPRRGPGGGKVRERTSRKAGQRRRMGMADFLFMGVIAAAGVIGLEKYLLKQGWLASIIAGAAVAVLSVAYQWFLERRRLKKQAASPTSKGQRRR
jgi:hypothetical protein